MKLTLRDSVNEDKGRRRVDRRHSTDIYILTLCRVAGSDNDIERRIDSLEGPEAVRCRTVLKGLVRYHGNRSC